MYSYEGNKPHSLESVFDDRGHFTCEGCGACVCDHKPVDGAVALDELRWIKTVEVKMAYGKYQDYEVEPEEVGRITYTYKPVLADE